MPNAASKILSGSLAGAAPSRRQGLGGGGGGGGGGAGGWLRRGSRRASGGGGGANICSHRVQGASAHATASLGDRRRDRVRRRRLLGRERRVPRLAVHELDDRDRRVLLLRRRRRRRRLSCFCCSRLLLGANASFSA